MSFLLSDGKHLLHFDLQRGGFGNGGEGGGEKNDNDF